MLNNEVWRRVLTSFVFVYHVQWPCYKVTGNINISIIIQYKNLPDWFPQSLSVSHQFAHLPWYFAWEPLVVEEGCGIFIFYPSESIIKVMRSVITSSGRLKLVNRLGWLVIQSSDPDCPPFLLLIVSLLCLRPGLWALACCHSILNIYFLSIKLYEWLGRAATWSPCVGEGGVITNKQIAINEAGMQNIQPTQQKSMRSIIPIST